MSDDKAKLVDGKSETPSFGSIKTTPEDADSKEDTDSNNSETKKSAVRWYILMLFCLWALSNLAFWNTWGPIAQSAMLVFGWGDLEVVLPVILGTFAAVLMQIFYSWFLEFAGLRIVALVSACLMLIGAGIRCVTSSIPAFTWLVNVAAILNGLGAPIFIGGAPVISAVWFPASERITATSSGIAFAYGGIAFAFLLGPFVVNYAPETFPGALISNTSAGNISSKVTQATPKSSNFSEAFIDNQRHNVMNLMYIEFGWIAFLFLVTVAYFPDKPATPPSLSALQIRTKCWEGLRSLFTDIPFVLILVPFALTQGFYFGWSSALELNLHPIGITQNEAGWVGFASSMSGIVGTLIIGRLADVFSRYLKIIVILFLAVAIIFFAWMTAIIDRLMPVNLALLIVTIVISSTAIQATCPLFFEMACESSYPVSESVIAGVLTMSGNVINAVFLLAFLKPNVGTKWLNYAVIGALVVSALFVCFYEQRFRRLTIDEEGTESNASLDDDEKNSVNGKHEEEQKNGQEKKKE